MKDVGYSVIERNFVGDEETSRDTRIIKCSSLEDFKEKMQKIASKSYNKGDDKWKLEAPQIFSGAFEKQNKEIQILYYSEFCDKEPLLIWKEEVQDFSRFYRWKRGDFSD
jgi:hypothetical protein